MRDNVNVECFHYFFTPHARLSCYATVKEFVGLYFINLNNFTLNNRVHTIKITLACSFVLLIIFQFGSISAQPDWVYEFLGRTGLDTQKQSTSDKDIQCLSISVESVAVLGLRAVDKLCCHKILSF